MNYKKKWLIIHTDDTKMIFHGDAKQVLECALRFSKRFWCLPVEEARNELPHYPILQ